MKRHILVSSIAFIVLIASSHIVFATSWAYPFVVWNDSIYVVTDEVVTDIEKKIGKVTSYSDMEQKGGNFSNRFPKGTAYYAIKDVPTNAAIAIEIEKEQYIKASYEGKYAYSGDVWNKMKMLFLVVVVAIIAFIVYYILPSFKKI